MADALRSSGDREALALWDGPDYGPGYDRLVELAEQSGAGAFVALDFYVEVDNPGAISRLAGGMPVSRRVGRRG